MYYFLEECEVHNFTCIYVQLYNYFPAFQSTKNLTDEGFRQW